MNTYTLIDNGKVIGIGLTPHEVSEITGLQTKAVSQYSSRDYLYDGRYKVIKDGEIDRTRTHKLDIDFIRDWDDMMQAAELIRAGRGRIVTKRRKGKIVKYVEVIKC
jgi:hypothetical protein